MEKSEVPPNDSSDDGHHHHLPQLSDSNGDGESERKLSAEQVKEALQITASTGKFWLDWDDLKTMLFFQLKQVLSEYPEATMPDDQQNSALGETYSRLLQRLEEALFSFVEGPPFTLQRLSEILLDARKIYPKLSKLALALEKNLLVTSTLTKSTDPYPTTIVQPEEQAQDTQPQPQPQPQPQTQTQTQTQTQPQPQPQPQPQSQSLSQPQPEHEDQQPEPERVAPQSDSVENGRELMMGDRDEVMTEVDAEVEGGITIDMETFEEIITTADTNPEPTSSS